MTINQCAAPVMAVISIVLAASCSGEAPDRPAPPPPSSEQSGAVHTGGQGDFPHSPDIGAKRARDPFEILEERQEEGEASVRSRLHSCQKLQIKALRSLLGGLGVNLNAPAQDGPPSAAALLEAGVSALGAADYDARVGERVTWTTSGATKLFDIFVQAAPEIIANLPSATLCKDDGDAAGPAMFDAEGRCNPDAVTCLIGFPATTDHLIACDNLVESASTPARGRELAVAALLSAAYSCE